MSEVFLESTPTGTLGFTTFFTTFTTFFATLQHFLQHCNIFSQHHNIHNISHNIQQYFCTQHEIVFLQNNVVENVVNFALINLGVPDCSLLSSDLTFYLFIFREFQIAEHKHYFARWFLLFLESLYKVVLLIGVLSLVDQNRENWFTRAVYLKFAGASFYQVGFGPTLFWYLRHWCLFPLFHNQFRYHSHCDVG